MTVTRNVNTLKEAAKVMLEEQKQNRYPIKFSLPNIVFSDEGERASLSPSLQATIEEEMVKLNTGKNTIYKLSLKGLVEVVADGKKNPESGNDVKLIISPDGTDFCASFSNELDVSKLSYHDLLKLRKALDSIYPKNNGWKYAKFLTLSRIKKLKGNKQ